MPGRLETKTATDASLMYHSMYAVSYTSERLYTFVKIAATI